MKNIRSKRSIALLIVAVSIIWGIILYRIASYSSGEQTIPPGVREIRANGREKDDTLLLNYCDPFLKEMPAQLVKSLVTPRIKSAAAQPDILPTFRLAGRIRKGKRDFLLIVSGNETRLVSVWEKRIDGFRIEKIYSDSIRVRRGSRMYTLRME